MNSSQLKKQRERLFVEETARLLEADWSIVEEREEPDFIVRSTEGCFGLEVVQSFVDRKGRSGSPMREHEGRNQALMLRIQRCWEADGGRALNVSVLRVARGSLTKSDADSVLAALRRENANSMHTIEDALRLKTESGMHVLVSPSLRPRWRDISDTTGWVARDAFEKIQESIAEKQLRLAVYRENAGQNVRLLVVADHHLASGMLYLESPEKIDRMGFDEVYFLPHPGGPVSTI